MENKIKRCHFKIIIIVQQLVDNTLTCSLLEANRMEKNQSGLFIFQLSTFYDSLDTVI